jgi:Fur family ferric uptake transcriptional regulator
MTLAPRRDPLVFNDVDEVAEAIREHGGRLSSARRVVLAALFEADGPVSAEYIADGLGGRMIRSEVSSVYRNLERLEELGVVRHVHVGHGPGLYALESGTEREYLVCERCSRVDTVDAERLDRARAEIRKQFGYEARFSHFPIVGLCRRCAAAAAGGSDARVADQRGAHEHSHGGYVHGHEHGLEEHAH